MMTRPLATAWVGCLLLALPAWSMQESDSADSPEISASLFSNLRFRNLGPALMSGRIVDIAVDPERRSTWYIAAASGGVWKTTNAGTTWTPIFDRYGSYSIGCLAIDPHNRHVIWVGTGENNSQRSVGYGDGLYKSLDGGQTFNKVGLEQSEHIAKILVDPRDSNTVYVASQGPLWRSGGDRGLYKTTDGGATWKQVLTISEDTGVTDVVMDPRDPDTLYAAAYQRRRHVWTLINGGPESGMYKSTDGGNTWRKINRGLPSAEMGRIGLAISPIQPDVLYAIVEAAQGQGGFFRSANRGESWVKQGDYVSGSPQYYQEIVADPHKFDRIYSLDTYMMVSEDGGRNFTPLGEADKHVDNHALVIDPQDAEHLLIGCDGGVYESWDRGRTYDFKANLPLTQFYKIAVSNDQPFYYVYGGTQDNATQGGPTRTSNIHGIRNSDWFITVFGDGFGPAVDPEEPHLVYSQWQYGGLVRYDRRNGERIDIKPQPEADGPPLRWNWDSALLISPHNPARVYYAAQILFRSDDRGNSWTAISGDLTRNLDRNKLKVMGRVWGVDSVAKNASTSFYGTIVALDESPLVDGLLYVGTDDGLVQVSEDGGDNWRKIERFEFLDVPEYAYVNDIECSRHDPDTVYVALNNHKQGDFRPYLLKSTDRGKTWSNISSNLPQRGSLYTVVEDPERAGLLFVGSEFGIHVSLDGGKKWLPLSSGLPTIAVRDLKIQARECDLVVGTFGRGFYVLDDYSPLRQLDAEQLTQDAHLFATKTAKLYVESAPLAVGEKAFQGANFFTAPNPPVGATFTFYLKNSLTTERARRQQQERGQSAAGKDVPYPSWEQLKREDREEQPRVFLTIRDQEQNVVRRLGGPTSQGMHRVTWDFRYGGFPSSRPGRSGFGPLAVPGTYTVEISQFVNGEAKTLVEATEFEVEFLGTSTLPAPDRQEVLAFQQQTGELQRAVMAAYQVATEAQAQVEQLKQLVAEHPKLDPGLHQRVRQLELALLDTLEVFDGDPTRPARNEPALDGIMSRIQTIVRGHWTITSGPTDTHRQQYEIAEQKFREVLPTLRKLVESDLKSLNGELDQAKVPWTPGRGLPNWK